MKTVEMTLASSQVNGEKDVLSEEALNTLAEQINTHFLPIGIEHDPRLPDSGRFISAEVVAIEDGVYIVKGTGELFEKGDVIPLDETREMPVREYNGINIIYDLNFNTPEDQNILQKLSSLVSASPEEERKKNIDSLSILLIGAGVFLVGKFCHAFQDEISDYDAFKAHIKSLMSTQRCDENLLECEFSSFKKENEIIDTSVILTNPSPKDIDLFFDQGLKDLDALLIDTLKDDDAIKKVVLEYQNGILKILHAIRQDAVPMVHVED